MRENKVFVKMVDPAPVQPPKKSQTPQPKPLTPAQPSQKPYNVSSSDKNTLGAMFSFMGKDEAKSIQQVFRLASITIMAQMNRQTQRMKEINQEEKS